MANAETILTTKLQISSEHTHLFSQWQADYNAAIATFPGFISLEILSPFDGSHAEWIIVQRFKTNEQMEKWRNSSHRHELLKSVKNYLIEKDKIVTEEISDATKMIGGITEVFITEVPSEQDKQYRDWMAKIHQVESRFPGFRGTYVQSPSDEGKHWITMLQFDTSSNLDRWLESKERKEILHESESMISNLERHRVISPYAGWFSSMIKAGKAPPAWKQSMVVLLVLFPIVMLEMKYLSPLTVGLDVSLATFISNAISVALLAWPAVPLAIRFLRWWLLPQPERHHYVNWLGTVFVLGLYLLEIALFWNFLTQ